VGFYFIKTILMLGHNSVIVVVSLNVVVKYIGITTKDRIVNTGLVKMSYLALRGVESAYNTSSPLLR
jgi:hypothetical protein